MSGTTPASTTGTTAASPTKTVAVSLPVMVTVMSFTSQAPLSSRTATWKVSSFFSPSGRLMTASLSASR